MTYNKPSNISYTDMCIWIDQNAYKDSCDDLKLYEYLYHLVNMLAHEGKYFTSNEYYDEFSLYGATRLCLRLKNVKQFEVNSEGVPKLPPIKSILNYLKTIIYPYKVDFEQEYYSHTQDDLITLYENTFDFTSYLADESSIYKGINFKSSIDGIISVIKGFLQKIPIKYNSKEWYNIYISCLLTILNSITISQEMLDTILVKDDLDKLDKCYVYLRSKDPILYHLDLSYNNYIITLVSELRHLISKELSIELDTRLTSDISMKNLILTELDNEE